MPGRHLDTLSADELLATIPSLTAMLIAMRDIDTSDYDGYGSWDEEGNGLYPSFAAQLLDVANDSPNDRQQGWSDKLKLHPVSAEVFARGYEQLVSLTTYLSDDRALIHVDTLNFNVNVERNRISGIYDWGCAMWGDPIYDLAWFKFWEPWYPQWADVHLADRLIQDVGILGPHGNERLHSCLLHIALSHTRYHAFIENRPLLEDVTNATLALIETSK
ncbi:MAG: aminoglycoside phosphotransferase family protein [Thermomicrobiales bacterium]|nr:aminoglycoside phosphotransferase family protein [Thermomicrobiales bacterium]